LLQSYELGKIKEREIYDHVVKNVVQGRLTFKRLFKGAEMTPTFASQGETLLIRSLPRPSPRSNVTSIQYTDPGMMALCMMFTSVCELKSLNFLISNMQQFLELSLCPKKGTSSYAV
jgi:hypothetical protein